MPPNKLVKVLLEKESYARTLLHASKPSLTDKCVDGSNRSMELTGSLFRRKQLKGSVRTNSFVLGQPIV
jgi:hypothetical protein